MNREELLSHLTIIKNSTEKIINAQSKQVEYVNDMRQEEGILEKQYDKETFSFQFLKNVFTLVLLSAFSQFFYYLVLTLLQGELGKLISNSIVTLGLIGALLFLMKKHITTKTKWVYPAILFILLLLASIPIGLLSRFNFITIFMLGLSGFLAWKLSSGALFDKWVSLFNDELKQEYDETVAHNNELKRLYNDEALIIDSNVQRALQEGEGWYPKDYYTHHAVTYFINCLENYRADSIKEMVQLYDTFIDRLERREYQNQMLAMQSESLINQQQMIGLLEHANILLGNQIAVTAEAARNAQSAAKSMSEVSQGISNLNSNINNKF